MLRFTPALGEVVTSVSDFNATGDGVTDDTAAIQAAIDALPASGGILHFPTGNFLCESGLSFVDRVSVRVTGDGGPTGGAAGTSRLTFTQTTGSRCIDARSTTGVTFENLYILQSGAGFTGHVVDFTHSAAAQDSSLGGVYRTFIDGVATAASLINLAKTHTMTVSGCNLVDGVCAIMGGGADYANQILVESNIFQLQATAPIISATGVNGQTWTITHNTFEPLASSAAAALYSTSGITGLIYSGNWHGDANTSGTWINVGALIGASITGNLFATGANGVVVTAAQNNLGNVISANMFMNLTKALDVSAATTWQGDFALNLFDTVTTPLTGTPSAGRYQTSATSQMNYQGSQLLSSAVSNGVGGLLSQVMWAVHTGGSANRGIVVKGAASQSANLQEWRDSADTVLARITSSGYLEAPGVNVATTVTDTVADDTTSGPYLTMGPNFAVFWNRNTVTNIPLIVVGMAGQTGKLQQWQTSGGTPVANIGPSGDLYFAGALTHAGTTAGFFGTTPVTQPTARADTAGVNLANLELEVNDLKAKLRALGLMAT
jgi:hypothetical protein